jgi:hypothetical protein
MKTMKYLMLTAYFVVAVLACKGKDTDADADATDTTMVTPSMEPVPDATTDTTGAMPADTLSDDDAPGVTKGEMEQVP